MSQLPVKYAGNGEISHIVDPCDGTLHPINEAALDVCARWVVAVRELEALAKTVKAPVHARIRELLDADKLWTRRVGDVVLSAPSPDAVDVEYDAAGLRRDLLRLARRGVITREAVERTVTVERTYKVSARGVSALLRGDDGTMKAVVDGHAKRTPKARTVGVKPA